MDHGEPRATHGHTGPALSGAWIAKPVLVRAGVMHGTGWFTVGLLTLELHRLRASAVPVSCRTPST